MSRKFRVRPRFFVFSALVLAGIVAGTASLISASPKRLTHPHRVPAPHPLGAPPIAVTRVGGRFVLAPVALPMPLSAFSVATPSSQAVALIGGYTAAHRVNPIIYSLTPAGVVADGRMTYPHADGGLIVVDGVVEYVGGQDNINQPSARIQPIAVTAATVPVRERWFKTALTAIATASDGNQAYIVGGQSQGLALNTIYRIVGHQNPTVFSHLPLALTDAMATVYRGSLWVLGGYNFATGYQSTIYTVNLTSGQITAVGELPVGLDDAAITIYRNDLWILGGETANGNSRQTYVIKPGGSLVHPGPILPQAVRADSAFVIDGRLWIGGGVTNTGVATWSLWWYQAPHSRSKIRPSERPKVRHG